MMTDRVIPEHLKKEIKIMVVEDNLLCRKLSAFLLKRWDFKFDLCIDGKHCIENLKLDKYDLILMDIQMPEMNGHDTTKHIREKLKLGLPIIAMTSHASEGERKKCLISGMNDYIAKPLEEEELHNLVVNYLFSTVVESQENKVPEKKALTVRTAQRV